MSNKFLNCHFRGIIVSAALVWALTGLANAQVMQGLQIYYPLNGNTLDSSGFSNNGSSIDVLFGADRFNRPNRAGMFNGITSLVTSSFATNIARNISLAAWVKVAVLPTAAELHSMFGVEESSLFLNAGLSGDSVGFQFQCNGTRQPQLARSLAAYLNRWAHIAIVRQSIIQRLYINGMLVDSANCCADVIDGIGNSFYVGGSPLIRQFGFTGFFNGMLDEFRVYNRSLTRAEVDTLSGNINVAIRPMYTLRASVQRNSENQVTIDSPVSISELTIYNVAGQLVTRHKIGNKHVTLAASNPGPIILQIRYQDGNQERVKL